MQDRLRHAELRFHGPHAEALGAETAQGSPPGLPIFLLVGGSMPRAVVVLSALIVAFGVGGMWQHILIMWAGTGWTKAVPVALVVIGLFFLDHNLRK